MIDKRDKNIASWIASIPAIFFTVLAALIFEIPRDSFKNLLTVVDSQEKLFLSIVSTPRYITLPLWIGLIAVLVVKEFTIKSSKSKILLNILIPSVFICLIIFYILYFIVFTYTIGLDLQ